LYGTLRDLAAFNAAPAATSQDVNAALEDDLNTPAALAALNRLAADARQVLEQASRPLPDAAAAKLADIKSDLVGSAALLGLLRQDPEAWFKRGTDGVDTAHVESLLEARRAARAARDFARADAIRDELTAMGVAIEDGPQGTRWKMDRP
jgi:cysteinyl-tRNA synthetase